MTRSSTSWGVTGSSPVPPITRKARSPRGSFTIERRGSAAVTAIDETRLTVDEIRARVEQSRLAGAGNPH
jgi:hypothetical protein